MEWVETLDWRGGFVLGIAFTFILSIGLESVFDLLDRRRERKRKKGEDTLELHTYGMMAKGRTWPVGVVGIALQDIDEGGEGDAEIVLQGHKTVEVTRDVKEMEYLFPGDLVEEEGTLDHLTPDPEEEEG